MSRLSGRLSSFFIILFFALLSLSLIACSSNEEETIALPDSELSSSEAGNTVGEIWGGEANVVGMPTGEYMFIRSGIAIGNNIDRIAAITSSNGIIYGAAETWSDDGYVSGIRFFSLDPSTEEVIFYPEPLYFTGSGHSLQTIAANSSGDIYFVTSEFEFNHETHETLETTTLSKVDRAGNIGFSVDISEHFDNWEIAVALALDYIGNLYLLQGSGDVLVFDSGGTHQFTVTNSVARTTGGPFMGADGTMFLTLMSNIDGSMLYSIDIETRNLQPHQPIPEAHSHIPGLSENELLQITMTGVYSYSLVTGEHEKVFHWLDVGVLFADILPVSEGLFALLDTTDTWHPTDVTLLTKSLIEDDNRTVVTLASLHPNLWLVHNFNQQSTEYRIVVLDYSNADTSVALTRFNIDMVAGNVPDIIDFTYLDYRAVATAGFLADMNVMFENDSRINRSDFHERVLELLEIDGNLYAMTPSFAVWTHLAPASLVGTSPGITMEQLIQLDERFNNGASLMQNETPQSFLERHGWVNRSSLIDIEAGTAHFDTDSFINILEYANSLGRSGQVLDRPNEDCLPFEQEIRRGNIQHFYASRDCCNLVAPSLTQDSILSSFAQMGGE